ncbi:RimJ/RimL family protein N-acetyltransferase [Arthrobacter sp. JUb119]|uniref:GNAT family N-acetyltransferase n=1 Tax=Arthrobacter sp. JUb115 TaxID=2485108 RepID=UPI00106097E0|nr:GNAT family protein [Arthrobacter sp. JUb115]MCS3494492.1 RimJ/RimL family protein N-acetyltransferase [Arthrobacter sp. JUb119]TDU22582.1 acetyltransferase (GNAT) family protein [Arthrobacter sp. JUb115]
MALDHRALEYRIEPNVRIVTMGDCQEVERLIGEGWTHLGNSRWEAPSEGQQISQQPKMFFPVLKDGCIRGQGLVLTHPRVTDCIDLCANEMDEGTRQHALFPAASDATIQTLVAEAYLGWRLGDTSLLIARTEMDGPPVAKLSIRRLVPPGVLDVGYATMPNHRGQGYAARALKVFTNWAFESAGIQRIELGIKPANSASVRTAIKAGYSLESVRRARLITPDATFDDEHSYVAIKSDRNREWGQSA